MKRVLHVLRRLDPGGIELWLRDVVLAGGIPGWRIEMLLETMGEGKLEADFRAAGVAIHRWRAGDFGKLARILRGFDAVHSHVHFFSGAILATAAAAGVPTRIAHSHACTAPASGFRRVYESAMRRMIGRFATHRLAVSSAAARSLYGTEAGVFPAPCFRRLPQPAQSCTSGGAPVIGHIGRLAPEKNHALLERILDAAPEFHLLLCGDGPDRPRLARHERIQFVHRPEDVLAGCSCFVFPSWSEGLGLAVVEAQAAGIPCVISDRVPREAWLVPELLIALDPGAPARDWAEAARRQSRRPRLPAAREWVCDRGGSLNHSISRLEEVYAGA
jgi:glycosyltransferase involved in cell wall biosynthesis